MSVPSTISSRPARGSAHAIHPAVVPSVPVASISVASTMSLVRGALLLALAGGFAATARAADSAAYSASTSAPVTRAEATFKNGPPSFGAVALTYDDGPHEKLTPQLMRTLKEAGAKATFFLLGVQVELYPEIAKALVAEGFELGNHSWSHRDMTKMTEAQIRDEVRRTQDAIEQATGVRPKLFRPPYGNINDRVFSVLREEGLDVVLWSIDPRDWDMKKSNDTVVATIEKQATGGSIVCIHDIHKRTVEATPRILEAVRAKGLGFATAGELIVLEREARLERKARGIESPGVASAAPELPATPPVVPLSKSSLRRARGG